MRFLKKIHIAYAAPILLVIVAFLYVFLTYSSWLTSDCIAPLGADIKFHISTVRSFVEQIHSYNFIYPVEYLQDISGFYWYTRGLLPIAIPAFLSFFLPLNTAFFLFYCLLYVLSTLAIYFFVKSFTDEYTGFLGGVFFLFSNLSNMVFSVGGNYQFFFGLLLFFLSMYFLLQYVKHQTKKYLAWLSLSVIALGMTYLFSLVFFISFAVAYALLTRQWKIMRMAVIFIVVLGFFLIPAVITSSYVSNPSMGNFPSPIALLKLYVLPSTPFGWVYEPQTAYNGQKDFSGGIQVYLAGLLALAYLFYKKIKTTETKFILTYLLVMVGWVALGFASRILPFVFLKSIFVNVLPTERLMMHTAFSFLFPALYVLHKLSIQWKSFIAVLFVGVLTLGTSFFTNKLFFAVLGLAVIFGLKEILKKEHIQHHHLLMTSALLLLLLFPLTGKVETTNLQARTPFFTVDDAKNYISPDDVFYFIGGWSLQESILSCTGAHSIVQIDRDVGISGLNGDIDLFDPSETTRQMLQQRGVTKVLIVLDKIVENNQINQQKVAHLVQWFGQPEKMQPKMVDGDKKQDYYPIFVFTVPKIDRDYAQHMVSPINIEITNPQHKDTLLINLEYHPWWGAVDASGKPMQIENDQGLMKLKDVGSIDKITFKFSLKYFIISLLVSIVGILLLIREIRRKHATS